MNYSCWIVPLSYVETYIDNRKTKRQCHKSNDNHKVRRPNSTNYTQVEENQVILSPFLDNRAIVNQILFQRSISSKISITDTSMIVKLCKTATKIGKSDILLHGRYPNQKRSEVWIRNPNFRFPNRCNPKLCFELTVSCHYYIDWKIRDPDHSLMILS